MHPSVLVSGDILLEHCLYGATRDPRADTDDPGTTLNQQLAGAALLHRLLHHASDADGLHFDARLKAWNEDNAKRTRQGKPPLPSLDDLPADRPGMKFDVTLGIASAQLEQTLPPDLHSYSVWTP